MALLNMQVFNDFVRDAAIEQLGQQVDKFNAASNGAIQLTADGFSGDFFERSLYSALHGAQRRVNRYGTNNVVASTPLDQIKDNSVKIAGGFGPIIFEPSQLTWIQKNEAEAIEMISRNFAEAMVKDELNSAIAALVAAISNQALATNDVSASGGVNYQEFNNSHALFGDSSMSLVAQVMNGVAYHNMLGKNLANENTLFKSDGVRVVDILGKAIVVTDSPALFAAGAPDKLKVLSLATGAAIVMDGKDIQINTEVSNGKERIETTTQVDYTFGLGLKGYAWDTNGGKSPSDAAIATGTNWEKIATDIKHTAGVITIGNASL